MQITNHNGSTKSEKRSVGDLVSQLRGLIHKKLDGLSILDCHIRKTPGSRVSKVRSR